MASLLVSAIKKQIAAGFRGRLLKGKIRRGNNYTMDQYGDVQHDGYTDYPFEGIRENFDAKYRQQALIPESDVKILVLLGSVLPKTANLIPQQNDQVFIGTPINQWHQVREVLEIDPAGASAMLQAYQIPAGDVLS